MPEATDDRAIWMGCFTRNLTRIWMEMSGEFAVITIPHDEDNRFRVEELDNHG